MNMTLAEQLLVHEELRLRVYDDATSQPIVPGTKVIGHPTIGIGRSLDTNGISRVEATLLLDHDITRIQIEVTRELPWITRLSDVRQRVLLDMAFNLGVRGLLGFRQTLTLLEHGQYTAAAAQMGKSKWAKQVGDRAKHLAAMMRDNTELDVSHV